MNNRDQAQAIFDDFASEHGQYGDYAAICDNHYDDYDCNDDIRDLYHGYVTRDTYAVTVEMIREALADGADPENLYDYAANLIWKIFSIADHDAGSETPWGELSWKEREEYLEMAESGGYTFDNFDAWQKNGERISIENANVIHGGI